MVLLALRMCVFEFGWTSILLTSNSHGLLQVRDILAEFVFCVYYYLGAFIRAVYIYT